MTSRRPTRSGLAKELATKQLWRLAHRQSPRPAPAVSYPPIRDLLSGGAVYTKTIAQVECTGAGGFACGWSIAEGSSYSVALAKAMAQAAVDVGTGDASAFCVADVEAVAGAIAEAAASAESKACVHGIGSEKDFQEAFVESVAEAVASAFVTATAKTCDGNQ